jgi:DNA-binding NtrC family response regulator
MRTVAVIDDDRSICDFVADALGELGADVQCAITGRLGRRLLTSARFDLALIDVVLPGASGFALAEIAANQNTPPLLMTGHPDAAGRAIRFDFPCLLKPFTLVRLCRESERVMVENRRNIQRIKDGMIRLRMNLLGFEDT